MWSSCLPSASWLIRLVSWWLVPSGAVDEADAPSSARSSAGSLASAGCCARLVQQRPLSTEVIEQHEKKLCRRRRRSSSSASTSSAGRANSGSSAPPRWQTTRHSSLSSESPTDSRCSALQHSAPETPARCASRRCATIAEASQLDESCTSVHARVRAGEDGTELSAARLHRREASVLDRLRPYDVSTVHVSKVLVSSRTLCTASEASAVGERESLQGAGGEGGGEGGEAGGEGGESQQSRRMPPAVGQHRPRRSCAEHVACSSQEAWLGEGGDGGGVSATPLEPALDSSSSRLEVASSTELTNMDMEVLAKVLCLVAGCCVQPAGRGERQRTVGQRRLFCVSDVDTHGSAKCKVFSPHGGDLQAATGDIRLQLLLKAGEIRR